MANDDEDKMSKDSVTDGNALEDSLILNKMLPDLPLLQT